MRPYGAAGVVQNVLDVFPQQLAIVNEEGVITYVNESWMENARQNGHRDPTPDAFVGVNYLELCRRASDSLEGDIARRTEQGLRAVICKEQARFSLEYPCHPPGGHRWFSVDIVPLRSEPGAAIIHTEVTGYKERQLYAAHLASVDSLTGLTNRLFFQKQAEQLLASAQRRGRIMQLLYMDLGDFKRVNDTLGHEAGDDLLRHIAKRLGACARDSDLLGRLGGDEFVVLIEDAYDPYAVGARYLRSLEDAFTLRGHAVQLNMSIGVSEFPAHGATLQQLMQCADIAM